VIYPFEFIDSKITGRDEFQMNEGRQPTHALFYLKEGSFSLEIDGQSELLTAGDCVILPDYVKFQRRVVEPIVFIYVKFACNKACPFTLPLPFGRVEIEDKARFLSNLESLEGLLERDDKKALCFKEHILTDILFQICTEHDPAKTELDGISYSDGTVRAAAQWIRDHLTDKLVVEDVCRAVGTNASTLNFKFRRETELSVGRFIESERMRLARHLLLGTTYSISEIAARCGFENVYYFSTAFKKVHGISPQKYRIG
jgi:AraC-like DNA-binding protein